MRSSSIRYTELQVDGSGREIAQNGVIQHIVINLRVENYASETGDVEG
jgi:hypothetical protein